MWSVRAILHQIILFEIQSIYLAHIKEQPNFRIPNIYNEIFVLIFVMILRTHFEASWDLERTRKGCVISIYKLQNVLPYCLIKQVNKILGIPNSEIWLFDDVIYFSVLFKRRNLFLPWKLLGMNGIWRYKKYAQDLTIKINFCKT